VRPFPLVLSSPSGGGKTTIMRSLLSAREDLGYSISATTRKPRPEEVDGRDYFFIARADFQKRIKAGAFIESAEYGGEMYGTLRSQIESVLASGRHVVLDVDIQGAREVRRIFPDAVLVFIMPPSAEELYRRLEAAGTRTANLDQRLQRAVAELNEAPAYDYIVVNADLTEAVAEVAAILNAETRRPRRMPELEEQLRVMGRDVAAMRARTMQQAGG
jgi:guanylate kinase